MTRPPLGPADLLVESGQGFVHGWTESRVRDYGDECAAEATAPFAHELERLRNRRQLLPHEAREQLSPHIVALLRETYSLAYHDALAGIGMQTPRYRLLPEATYPSFVARLVALERAIGKALRGEEIPGVAP